MNKSFSRMQGLFSEIEFEKLNNSSVIVFGVGGVGSYVVEALARAGVGNITVVDDDVVDVTNINRQLIALNSTVGKDKVQVVKERVLDINPNCNVNAIKEYFDENSSIDLKKYDYIIDAIDSVKSKLYLAEFAVKNNIRVIQRFFLLDSFSLSNTINHIRENSPSAVEILPGLMPKIIKKIDTSTRIPVITGGLVDEKEDIINALGAGALGVSTTCKKIWDL